MGNSNYSVEISKTPEAMFISAIRYENTAESYLIELQKVKADAILKEFNNDMKSILQTLQILNRRLVLLNPIYIQKPKRRRIIRKIIPFKKNLKMKKKEMQKVESPVNDEDEKPLDEVDPIESTGLKDESPMKEQPQEKVKPEPIADPTSEKREPMKIDLKVEESEVMPKTPV